MYMIYFSSKEGSRLWHPAVTFAINDILQAKHGAVALNDSFPEKAWGYGPAYNDGVYEIV